jgi:hypothetical protein
MPSTPGCNDPLLLLQCLQSDHTLSK